MHQPDNVGEGICDDNNMKSSAALCGSAKNVHILCIHRTANSWAAEDEPLAGEAAGCALK